MNCLGREEFGRAARVGRLEGSKAKIGARGVGAIGIEDVPVELLTAPST
jgi:hypothetical protein